MDGVNQVSFSEVTTISFDQTEILSRIIKLHCPQGIEADVTYSIGSFYSNGIPKPKYRFDLVPQVSGIACADVQQLPIQAESFNSVMFDPPFLAGPGAMGKPGKMKIRFGCFKTMNLLWDFYYKALEELYRILKQDGALIFKCQDSVSSGKNWFSHAAVMNMAVGLGFYPKDLFILLVKHRMGMWHSNKQYHARKYHGYFWIFEKKECPIDYGGWRAK